ncbi:MAG TPA: hypothetical protein VIT23_07295 [Terrimicrobiaceae bacterium]
MIDFKNLIVGRHQTKVVFVWNPENGVSMLGVYRGIEDGIRAILAGEITPAQRVILEEFREVAGKSNWDFTTLKQSLVSPDRKPAIGGCCGCT